MKAKNTTMLARRQAIIDEFGIAAWDGFTRDMARRYPVLAEPLVATSALPIDTFLAINDELLKHFYKGNTKIYSDLGRASAEWALLEGPYKAYAQQGLEAFVRAIPRIWTTYYIETNSRLSAELDDKRTLHAKILDLGMWHPYFEYLVVGYIQRALEIVANRTVPTQAIKSGPAAINEIYYRFFV